MTRYIFLPLIVILLYLFLALYRLDTLPGEWFGDISNLHEYVLDIQKGTWPLSYRQGVGPLYHYIVTPLTRVTGQRYIGYKLLSVASGLFSLLWIYALAREIGGKKLAILTLGISSCSFWFLVWARLGNLHALIPGVVAAAFYFLYRWERTQKSGDLLTGGVVASLGVFLYVGTFILPVVWGSILVLRNGKTLIRRPHLCWCLVLLFLLCSFLFYIVVSRDPSIFFSPYGYVGEKMFGDRSLTGLRVLRNFGEYGVKTLGMFFFSGDHIFRVNVPDGAILDPISRIGLILGVLTVFMQKKVQANRVRVMLPFILLLIPAMFPTLPAIQVPSSTRTFGVFPFVMLLIAFGGQWVIGWLQRYGKFVLESIGAVAVGIMITWNVHHYFVDYAYALPNHNAAFGSTIASFIDSLDPSTPVAISSCCWGQWGEPDPKGVYYQLEHKAGRENLVKSQYVSGCDDIQTDQEIVVLVRPDNHETVDRFASCRPNSTAQTIYDTRGEPIVTIVKMTPGNKK